ncbi:hypothetical protein [Rubripirellula reticaptiva]|uniref:Uncharacterized protein n=1 Tax=Rubripirellula reticaptiva TaxID=2528013 RepID=A0A5C6ERD4_9BACT|nr:hypothetical protein [Rubripirellula reticaptiva]TWU51498.1 hypothetical protein Poly59_30900 [Rubripirellula reticaptiva]
MAFRLKLSDTIAIAFATLFAAFAVWMNIPDHRFTDTVALWERIDDATPNVTPDVYLNTGFPFHYHRVKVLPGGKTAPFRETPRTLWLNSLLCFVGVAGAFGLLRILRFPLWGMFMLVSLSAVLFWADSQFKNLTYFYVLPTVFFLPTALFIALLGWRWIARPHLKTAEG